MSEEKQSLAGAYAKLEGHEDLCAERLKNIHGRINLLFAVLGAAGLISAGAAGWAFNKVWDGQQQTVNALQAMARAVPSAPALPH